MEPLALPAKLSNLEVWKVNLPKQEAESEIEPTWWHIQADGPEAEIHLNKLDLSTEIKEGLLADETRPKCYAHEDGLLLFIRGINNNKNAEVEDMVSLRVWMTNCLVITTWKKGRGLLSVSEVRKEILDGKGPKDTGGLLIAIIEKITDKISKEVEYIDDALGEVEDIIGSSPENIERQNIVEIRRRSAQIKRFLAPQREALDSVISARKFVKKTHITMIKRQSERLLRYLEELDLARERCVMLLEELRHVTAEEQGARMYVLSIVTAIFLPLAFLTGVFGMNVAGLPGTENPSAFILLSICMVFLAVVVILMMKFKKWL